MAVYFIILGIKFKIKGFRPAKYYLLAWGALVIGIIFAILESLNLIFVMTYLNAMQIGSALEVILLSFALGDRINAYKKEKEAAQLKAFLESKKNEKLIQEQNIILEQKVKERTAEVALRNEELVQLNREKDMLVDIVAHDLRTPLHQIKGIMWVLDIPSIALPEEKKTYLNTIYNSVERLSGMIGRILNTHALETNKINLKTKIIDLVDIVTYVTKSFELLAKEKNIKLILKKEAGQHFAEIDKNYMIQVLENLLSNAIKFSEKQSEVILHVKTQDNKASIEIHDNGPGISKKDQKKLFGRFQRLSAQPTAGESSMGLGLSIVKKYVDAMNGEISCDSTLGVGTCFTISFVSKN
jgi:signal transduction histidine kinase